MIDLAAALSFLLKEAVFFVSYVKHNAFPQPLSPEDEKKYLALHEKGDRHARAKLIEHNLRLVAHIVKKFEKTHHDTEDLISIGTIGLIKGIESYSGKKGTKLATYAARCIENEILMHFRSLKKTKKDVSLYDPVGRDKEGNEISLLDLLKTEDEDVAARLSLQMDIDQMKKCLSVLDDRELSVIAARYGLVNDQDKTQREIAAGMNISRSYVSRIEKRALAKMMQEFKRIQAKQKRAPKDLEHPSNHFSSID
ncbi:RNA polymerase sporulation sigma factor SigK [Domibacillus indicus]|uniref:RNA polymerase sporulation sigma factor SigK n=1 Tax=Domibacillus indicus TaxID=1437523 RepID=UPI0006182354|nr:RNA polymerase sporulation sigma factor SigK [Domibacillus indicus]